MFVLLMVSSDLSFTFRKWEKDLELMQYAYFAN